MISLWVLYNLSKVGTTVRMTGNSLHTLFPGSVNNSVESFENRS